MIHASVAGLLYFVAVFAIGFALGTLRVLLIAPRIGELAAVLIELPLMLVLAWAVCGALVRRCAVPPRLAPRLTMGVVAFAVLMVAELAMASWLFGRTLDEHRNSYRALATQLGLAGQLLFALFPWLHMARR